MDRKSKQKIGIFICCLVLTAVVANLVLVKKQRSDERLFRDQCEELTTLYPENKAYYEENYSYYIGRSAKSNLKTSITITASLVLFGGIVLSIYAFDLKYRRKKEEEKRADLLELIRNLRKGQRVSGQDEKYKSVEEIYAEICDLEKDTEDLKKRLSEEENSTKALITNISHQLKTPIAAIKMSHDLANEEGLSEDERRTFIESESREIAQMEVLLDELVKLSRLESSMITLDPISTGIKNTVSEAVSKVFMSAASRHIEIMAEADEDYIILHDPKWTAEALANVLDNGIKYSPENEKLLIRITKLPQNVMIEVEDNGIGIPERELNSIFKRFYRGSNAKNISKDGAGVGLYLAREIIERQGGCMIAKRKTEGGSIFQMLLPG